MEKQKNIQAIFICSFFMLILPYGAFAQTDQKSAETDSISAEKKTSKHSLYTFLGYGSNMVLASSVSQAHPYYYGALSYSYNNELFVSACTFRLPEFDPFIAYNTFGLNYNHVFNSWFDISTGISRYQVTPVLADTLFNSFSYGDLTLGVDWKLIYTRLSISGIFSETSGAYFQMKNSRYFQTPEFMNKKAFISFDPYINLLMGNLTRTVTSEGTTVGVSSPFNTSGGGRNSTGSGSGSGSTSTTTTFFGLMEIDLGIPVGFNVGNFTVEAEPGYVLPQFEDPLIPSPKGFVFMLSCYIKIF